MNNTDTRKKHVQSKHAIRHVPLLHAFSGPEFVYGVQTEWRGAASQKVTLRAIRNNGDNSDGGDAEDDDEDDDDEVSYTIRKQNIARDSLTKISIASTKLTSDSYTSIFFQAAGETDLYEVNVSASGAPVRIDTTNAVAATGTSLASLVSLNTIFLFYQGEDKKIYFVKRGADGHEWDSPQPVSDRPATDNSGLSATSWLDGSSTHIGLGLQSDEDNLAIYHAKFDPGADFKFGPSEYDLEVEDLGNAFAFSRVRYPAETGAEFDKFCVTYQKEGDDSNVINLWAKPDSDDDEDEDEDEPEDEDAYGVQRRRVSLTTELTQHTGFEEAYAVSSIGMAYFPEQREVIVAYATSRAIFSHVLSVPETDPRGGIILEMDHIKHLVKLLGKESNDKIAQALYARFKGLLAKMEVVEDKMQVVWENEEDERPPSPGSDL